MRNMLLCIILFVGCKASYVYQPIDAIDVIYSEGNPVSISPLEESLCMMVASREGNEIYLNIYISNESSRRVTFFPDSVKVYGINENPGKGEDDPMYGITSGESEYKHYTYNFREYIRKIETANAIGLGLMAFNAGMSASQAGYSTSTTYSNYTGSTYSNFGHVQGSVQGQSTTTTYDQSKVNEANYRNQQQLSEMNDQAMRSIDATEQGLLKTTTLFPNDNIEGGVIIKLTNQFTGFLRVEIPLGETLHTFYLSN